MGFINLLQHEVDMHYLRPYFAVAHIASQVLYRGLDVLASPPPERSLEEAFGPLEMWSQELWHDLILNEVTSGAQILPWLGSYLRAGDAIGAGLAALLAQHTRRCREQNAHYVLRCDLEFPPLLREVDGAPAGLTVLGNVRLLQRASISVIGSRRASHHALRDSFLLGEMLGQAGLVCVSGGAYGCDIVTHRGMLQSGTGVANAIVVLAGGLGRWYPAGNLGVFRDLLAAGGTLVSERLWDGTTRRYDFPIRNRIISGASWLTVVMHAGARSGALVTAKLALEQGRELFVRDDPHDASAEGNRSLIMDGAYTFAQVAELSKLFSPCVPGRMQCSLGY